MRNAGKKCWVKHQEQWPLPNPQYVPLRDFRAFSDRTKKEARQCVGRNIDFVVKYNMLNSLRVMLFY